MSAKQFSVIDKLLIQADHALRTLTSSNQHSSQRPNPSNGMDENKLSDTEREHAAGLMRVNHSGEVCAQALYQGQALTAKLPDVREDMENAAKEEIDHLHWCEERLQQLGSQPSLLNPIWYGLSFSIGAGAGLISDKISLGFVAATEEQVSQHLEGHLGSLPSNDSKSQMIVNQMLEDERKHGEAALKAGGAVFPQPVKATMSLVSKVMTSISYKI